MAQGAHEELKMPNYMLLLYSEEVDEAEQAARWAEMEVAECARFKFGAGAIGVLGHERETRAIEHWNLTPDGESGR